MIPSGIIPDDETEPAQVAPAQSLPPTLEWLAEICTFWQHALGLAHYRISIQFNSPELDRNESQGRCSQLADDTEALILIADLTNFEGAFAAAFRNYELTIIHELLHITLNELGDTNQRRFLDFTSAGHAEHHRHLEQAINRLAGVLLALRYASPGEPVSPGWIRAVIIP